MSGFNDLAKTSPQEGPRSGKRKSGNRERGGDGNRVGTEKGWGQGKSGGRESGDRERVGVGKEEELGKNGTERMGTESKWEHKEWAQEDGNGGRAETVPTWSDVSILAGVHGIVLLS